MTLGALLATLLASAAATQAPAPERGAAVVLEPVSGQVLVRTEGADEYRRLRRAERLPVGTTVDAQEGRVRLTVARNAEGATWSAVFSQGKFTVTQPAEGEPVTTLTLTGPTFRETCGDRRRGPARQAQARAPAVGRTGTAASARPGTTRPPPCGARSGSRRTAATAR